MAVSEHRNGGSFGGMSFWNRSLRSVQRGAPVRPIVIVGFYNFSPQHFESLGKCATVPPPHRRTISSDFLGKWECTLNGGILGDVLPSLENTLLDSPDFTSKKHFFKAFVGSTIVATLFYTCRRRKREKRSF